ncbi:unnamed protein product [Closterium sp. NIES-65]|nr:unnamed protein product [Closterium sp. NIES-65]
MAEELRCFVGGLSYNTDDRGLMEAFSQYGAVDAKIVNDRETGRSRGFGFVSFNEKPGMDQAIEAMNGQSLDGLEATVAPAAAVMVALAAMAGVQGLLAAVVMVVEVVVAGEVVDTAVLVDQVVMDGREAEYRDGVVAESE